MLKCLGEKKVPTKEHTVRPSEDQKPYKVVYNERFQIQTVLVLNPETKLFEPKMVPSFHINSLVANPFGQQG